MASAHEQQLLCCRKVACTERVEVGSARQIPRVKSNLVHACRLLALDQNGDSLSGGVKDLEPDVRTPRNRVADDG